MLSNSIMGNVGTSVFLKFELLKVRISRPLLLKFVSCGSQTLWKYSPKFLEGPFKLRIILLLILYVSDSAPTHKCVLDFSPFCAEMPSPKIADWDIIIVMWNVCSMY